MLVTLKVMKNQGWILAAGLLFVLQTPVSKAAFPEPMMDVSLAGAPAEGLRLIETAPGQRAWMTPDEVIELAKKSHAEGHCGGFMDVSEHSDQVFRSNLTFLDVVGYPDPRHQEKVNALLPKLSSQQLTDTVDHLSNQFKNRFLRSPSGVKAAEWIHGRFLELAQAQGRTDVTVELVKHKKFAQPSVIARIPGSGPNASERVILGAHEDSVNWSGFKPSNDDRAPGADDDASGVATLIETFRVLMEDGFRPDRTVEFITYAGEELGLLGSQDIAKSYANQGIQVVGVQQFDMTLYPGKDAEINIISDFTNKELNRYTAKLLDTYVQVKWRESKCGYGCSDHASWHKAGFPASFPFEAQMGTDNPKIHSVDDTLAILDPAYGMHFVKLALAFAVEMGNP
jgi:leucyl aminopeptidase